PSDTIRRQPDKERAQPKCHWNVPPPKHFMHRGSITRFMDSEIENARTDPQASLARENRLQGCREQESAAKRVAGNHPEKHGKTFHTSSCQFERRPQNQ